MIHTIKKAITVLSLVIFGSALLYNCEPDADTLGEQLFLDGAAQGHEEQPFNVIAYNIYNNDSIRSDASKLGLANLGAFTESQFGMQKASYLTQLRLSTYDPDFGTNPVIDSVVLVIKPTYASDSVTTTTVDDGYTYLTAADGAINAKKVVNTYPVNKYGRAKIGANMAPFNIQVHEVKDFLKGYADVAYSNTNYNFDTNKLLGSANFNGYVSSIAVTKDGDGSALFTTSTPGIRIKLDETFFKDKIIAFQDKPELQDASNFIRHFNGLRISATQSDGYIMQFTPNDLELIMYYKYDKTDNGVTTHPQTSYAFALGSGNAHIGHYDYDRSNSQFSTYVIGNPTGDKKLFTQGMGGPSIGIKFPDTTINELKKIYVENKAAIISAKIRIYTDPVNWDNTFTKPTSFAIVQKDKKNSTDIDETTAFTTDLTTLVGSNNFAIYKPYDLDKNPAHYDFTVTQSVKDLVEGKNGAAVSNVDKYLKIDMGSFLSDSTTGGLVGVGYTGRSYARDRTVFVGNDPDSGKKIQLLVTYGTK
jgi:hypothetical protein